MKEIYDIFIIGGGINGAGIARDAAGRGLSVYLADKGKIGGATSSWSTKLIHGGLRYLENYEFKLVRESLKERDIIHNIASNITKEIPFIIPYNKTIRSKWLIKFGLFLYDHLGGKTSIKKSSSVNFKKEYSKILKSNYTYGFKYYDLQVDDKKLVELNTEDAKKNNAIILENVKVLKTTRLKDKWHIELSNQDKIESKILINASGPWINKVNNEIIKIPPKKSIRLVKGSHIITKKLYDPEVAFTLQNDDKRVVFVIPFKDKFSLIGTTENEVDSPDNNKIDKDEIKYLFSSVNNYFHEEINESHIVDTYSGIRPLIEDFKEASQISRDYIFDLNYQNNLAPLISVYGGKLTTYRKLAEKVLEELSPFLPLNIGKSWTSLKKL